MKLPPTFAEHQGHHGKNTIAQYVLNTQPLFKGRAKICFPIKTISESPHINEFSFISLNLPMKEPLGLQATQLTDIHGSFIMAVCIYSNWFWFNIIQLILQKKKNHAIDKYMFLRKYMKMCPMGKTLNIIEHAPIFQTVKFLTSKIFPDSTSHNCMAPMLVPTEITKGSGKHCSKKHYSIKFSIQLTSS